MDLFKCSLSLALKINFHMVGLRTVWKCPQMFYEFQSFFAMEQNEI